MIRKGDRMPYKEFKKPVEAKFPGYLPTYERNEIQYAAHILGGFCACSNPFSENICIFWNGKYVGTF